jgi:haloacetate dehalogenase
MSDHRDLFDGFSTHWVDIDEGAIFARVGGSGPPLLLLHGYPQTHVEWHKIAAGLAAHFTVVAMDLRGYGASFSPHGTSQGAGMSKRAMGGDAIAVMEALGFARFRLVGHDRGGRVAYRLAFDRPERLERIAVIDIIPTAAMFQGLANTTSALNKYHWLFLAQPAPFPETLIGAAPRYFLEHTLVSWTKSKSLDAFDPAAREAYLAAFDAAHIHTTCECYRAGALIDRLHDEADLRAGRKIPIPVLALWGDAGIPASGVSPLDIWRSYADHVEGHAIPSGHFIPEENPSACLAALLDFLR